MNINDLLLRHFSSDKDTFTVRSPGHVNLIGKAVAPQSVEMPDILVADGGNAS